MFSGYLTGFISFIRSSDVARYSKETADISTVHAIKGHLQDWLYGTEVFRRPAPPKLSSHNTSTHVLQQQQQ